ncbi:MAG: glucose-6-phosphate dehydrogenase assembly protein OpcA [Bryobacterales bacterium]|nr:glucose-6-phosphate dehydrogenase assembly protein OpcA [Bryobacterales bacterium]
MGTTAISPSRILKDLDALWLSLGEEQQHEPPVSGARGASPVLRACAMTLIAVVDTDDVTVGETLAMLVRSHPSRLIVLTVTPGEAPSLEAGVTAQCWMPFGKRQQICCEQISLSASRSSLPEIPPVIRGLIVPDLPVACWLRGRNLLQTPELEGVMRLADKLIVDSGGVADLAAQIGYISAHEAGVRRVGDLAWTRLTRWREAIAQLFDDAGGAARAQRLERIRIEYEGAHVPMSAYYLAAWLRHSLGRSLRAEIVRVGHFERARVCSVHLAEQACDVSITVTSGRDVQLHAGARDAHTVFPRLSEYELLREELSVLGPDPVYEAVIAAVPALLAESAGAQS